MTADSKIIVLKFSKELPIIKAASKYNIFLHLTGVPLRSTPAGEKHVGRRREDEKRLPAPVR
jgi:hypothetical protein